MEVVQWTALWNTFNNEFENEKNMLGGGLGDKAAEDLRQRVIEHVISHYSFNYNLYAVIIVLPFEHVIIHSLDIPLQNILVVSKYYSRITLKRLAELLCLSVQEAEKHLSDMVVSKALVAKIDRPMGIVCFQIAKDSNDILNS
ncbi:hypothetical protein U1Q18_024748 [Sarracenia purpurea var. burkii]